MKSGGSRSYMSRDVECLVPSFLSSKTDKLKTGSSSLLLHSYYLYLLTFLSLILSELGSRLNQADREKCYII